MSSVVPYPLVAYWLWIIFIASWYAAMLWTAKAVSRGRLELTLVYGLGFVLGFALLFSPTADDLRGAAASFHPAARALVAPRWHFSTAFGWLLVMIELACFAFAWWARVHLGKLWSGMLTLREGHRVVDTGPYGWVRHPIYTGFIGASWTLALIKATPASLAGAVVLTLVMSIKARGEEALLRRELGAEAYDLYSARIPMLVPSPLRRDR